MDWHDDDYILVSQDIREEMAMLGISDFGQVFRLIYLFLRADYKTNTFTISLKELAKELNITPANLSKELCKYRELGFIEIYKPHPKVKKHDFICVALRENEIIKFNNNETFMDLPCAKLSHGRNIPEYNKWRKACLERDGYRCQKCGSLENLCVHHIKPYAKYPKLATDKNNGITLCQECHKLEHRRMRNGE